MFSFLKSKESKGQPSTQGVSFVDMTDEEDILEQTITPKNDEK